MDNFAEGGVEQQFYVADHGRRAELDKLVEDRESKRVGDRFEEDPNGKEYDGRSLWEQLEANKATKQAELDEKYKFRVYTGLDEDESEFLTELSRQDAKDEEQRVIEDREEVRQFRKRAALTNAERDAGSGPAAGAPAVKRARGVPAEVTAKKGKSQAAIFARANVSIKEKGATSKTTDLGPATAPASSGTPAKQKAGSAVEPSRPQGLALGYAGDSSSDSDE